MTYATTQLTQALQELTRRSLQDVRQAQSLAPASIPVSKLQFAKELDEYLERKQAYAERTRRISIGNY